MRSDLPSSIVDSSFELAPDALVSLFEIELKNLVRFYLTPTKQVVWQANTYEEIPCARSDVSQESDGKRSRPKFSFVNPAGLFSVQIQDGLLDGASITRIRILKADLDADNDFAVREQYRVSKILTLNKDMVTVELRDVLDGHNFVLPARGYYPPEFPHVRLQ